MSCATEGPHLGMITGNLEFVNDKLGQEDILFGYGWEHQVRDASIVQINGVNATCFGFEAVNVGELLDTYLENLND